MIIGAIPALSGNYVLAQNQIVPDSTLGAESSRVRPTRPGSNIDEIQGGAIRGKNLFHSFMEFNVSVGQGAYFLSPNVNIQNILVRVTGGNRSQIMGILGTRGVSSPNLFLINPNGITFGPNASLDVGGSFMASTASSLKFSDGTEFSATKPQTIPLLTVSVPIGLQFGESSGNIVNQSFAVDSNGRYVGLQVQPGKTLALVGGDVVLDGSNITAEAGRIELGSVASPSRVSLTPTAQGWTLGYEGVQNFRDIQLTQGAVVQTYPNMGEGGGDIQVQGRRVTVSDGSFIADITGRSPSAGILTVSASESVKLIGSAVPATDAPQSASSLRTDTLGAGNAGDLRITTGKLIVQDGAQVSVGTTTGSTGRGGTLSVNAASVELSGTSADGQLASGLSAQSRGIGRAGNLKIATGLLSVRDQAQVTVGSLGLGATGNLEVTARTIHLDHRGKLTAESNLGQGGDIKLHDFDLLLLRHGSQISTTAGNNQNGGNGGKITIDTAFIVAVPEENSDIRANAFRGKGGNVQIAAEGIFGIQTQERNTPQSDITASGGQPSLNGVITINTPNVDPSRGLVVLPAAVVNLSGLIAQGCGTSDGTTGSQFVVTGHGGLPPNPGEPLSSDAIWSDARLRATTVNQHRSERVIAPKPSKQAAVPIVPATGWVFNNKGEVTLTALAPTVTPDIPWLTPTTCHAH